MSGISPSGNRVVVKPDEIEEVTSGGIILPPKDLERHQMAQATGILVAVGPDAFVHKVERVYRVHRDGAKTLVEERTTGYSEPFAKVGDRVAFAKYAGLSVEGEDEDSYRILNDEDITAKVSEGVNFTDLKSRDPFSKARRQGNV